MNYSELSKYDLMKLFLEELEFRKDSFTLARYIWLKNTFETGDVYKDKLLVISGYLMGVRDCGKDIGDLKLILEYIRDRV